MPNEIEKDLVLDKLHNGDLDAVQALFSNQNEIDYHGLKDPFNVTVSLDGIETSNYTDQIKLIIPEGFRDALSLNTGTSARFCIGYGFNTSDAACNHIYRAKIRAMATKIPGFLFMSYRQIIYTATVLLSEEQYKELLMDVIGDSKEL